MPDILDYLTLRDFLRAWVAARPEEEKTPLLRWMGKQVGLSRAQMWNLVLGAQIEVQAELVQPLARMLGLDDLRREYLRRLVALQSAPLAEARAARLEVWEMYAARAGLSEEISALKADHEVEPGAGEALVVAALPLLEAHAGADTATRIGEVMPGGPDPATVELGLALARGGLRLGEARGPRVVALPGLCAPGSLETACHHGALNLLRDGLFRVPQRDREFLVVTATLDAVAASALERAQRRIFSAVREVARSTAERPVDRLWLLSTGALPLTNSSGRADGTPPPPEVLRATRLTQAPSTVIGVERFSSPCGHAPGQPCLLHHLRLAPYYQLWVPWRMGRTRPSSVGWFARELELSRAQAHAILTGAARLQPEYVPRLAQLLELPEQERPYLEGMARLSIARDPQDRARERLALTAYANRYGVRTADGAGFQIAAHWGSRAIRALADLEGFRTNPDWISLRLGGRLTRGEAWTLVQAMLKVGMLAPQPEGPPQLAEVERAWTAEEGDPQAADIAAIAAHDSWISLLRRELATGGARLGLQSWLLALPESALPRVQRAREAYREEVAEIVRAAHARRQEGTSRLDRALMAGLWLCPFTVDLQTLRWR